MNELRAYITPPWRAQEWYFGGNFLDAQTLSSARIPVTFNGNREVPTGHRCVVKHAKMLVCSTDPGNPFVNVAFEDFSGGNLFTLKRKADIIPGWYRRPAGMIASQAFANDAPPDFQWKQTATFFDPDVLVPIQLDQGDTLTMEIETFGGGRVMLLWWFQGWIFPTAENEQSARGSAADPWGTY